jgi:Trk K+ transport system NAD-binding subunit
MPRKHRRSTYYVALVVATTVAFTLAYNFGMGAWEGRSQPLYRSLEVVFQTFTTTGYGEDAPWSSPQMNLLVVGMQVAGIGLILTAVDVFAVPWLRSALAESPPTTAGDVTDHVVVCEYTPRGEAFVAELDSRGREYVVVESDRERAVELRADGVPVVHGDPEAVDVLDAAGVGRARAVVADAADDANASIVLSAREASPDVRIVTLVEDAELARYHRVAGADDVLSPRQLLGESLAGRVPTAVSTAVDDGVPIGEDFELVELSVDEGSDLCDRAIAEAGIRGRFGVNVVGAWFDGDFETRIDRDATLDAGTTLLVAGAPDRLAALRDATASTVRRFSPREVLIGGFGQAGSAAYESLSETSSNLTVLDVEPREQVDVVGDARDPDVLCEAGIEGATALLLALGDDTTAIFTTLIARELNPDLEIVVRANERANVEKLYRAGADYVQSLATVSGRMLASTVFEDEEVLAYDRQIEIVQTPVGDLAGDTLADRAVRAETGATVVAVVRGDETITAFDAESFRFREGDEVVLVGSDESVRGFERRFGE